VFTLGNASDAFLLLRLSDIGIGAAWIPILWSALHVVKSASSALGGTWSDTFGRQRMIIAGWVLYSAVYFAFALVESTPAIVAIFIMYGLYFGMVEGAERALIADLTPAPLRGTAFGLYNAAIGVGALLASVLFGLVWTRISPDAAFAMGGALSLAAAGLLALLPSREILGRTL
jgi:MFS family permease